MTIAGSDSTGGAGIEADIKTIEALGLFATCAITAITAQNTTGVFGVEEISPEMVAKQIDVVFDDIRPDAVKIGMVSSPDIILAIAAALSRNNAENIVVDPVMVATSGSSLIEDDAVATLREALFPMACVITPNVPEAEVLSGTDISSFSDMEQAAFVIRSGMEGVEGRAQAALMLKGGHLKGEDKAMNDLVLTPQGDVVWLSGEFIDSENTHGTGCTLSSAIACGLAMGLDVVEACRQAKEYVHGAIAWGLNMGKGSGPLNHMWNR